MLAPASQHWIPLSITSSGVTGRCGVSALVANEPIGATVMISFSMSSSLQWSQSNPFIGTASDPQDGLEAVWYQTALDGAVAIFGTGSENVTPSATYGIGGHQPAKPLGSRLVLFDGWSRIRVRERREWLGRDDGWVRRRNHEGAMPYRDADGRGHRGIDPVRSGAGRSGTA